MLEYQIWLQTVLGYGNSRAKDILAYFGDAQGVYKADRNERLNSKLITNKELEKMERTPISRSLRIMAECNDNGIKTVMFGEEKYPYCLSVIDNPPMVLYYKGELPDFDNIPSVCVVGPRKVSEFGKKAAYSLSFRLAGSGMTVVSGGALGTDTYAHAGALRSGGKTALIMGCGLLSDYLKENEKLREMIAESGCLISEFQPRAEASRFTFPVRNRIMAALTLGTVVIEAGDKSGSLITARYAADMGRDVFVIPGSPDKNEYTGSNRLLRDGAKPLLDASDIFNEYIVRFPDKINIERAYSGKIITEKKEQKIVESKKIQKNSHETLSKEAKIVYNQLDRQKFIPEEIKNTGLNSAELLSALTELEMEFLIKALPGGMYEKL